MRTIYAPTKELEKKWFVVDAEGQTLGRLAVRIAHVLRGKHKPTFAPHQDTGDYVIVVNAAKVRVSGNKLEDKQYYRHSGYPGGLRATNLETMLTKKPSFVVEHAVCGMLPKSRLGRKLFRNLKVYGGSDHPHAAQMPQPLPDTIRTSVRGVTGVATLQEGTE